MTTVGNGANPDPLAEAIRRLDRARRRLNRATVALLAVAALNLVSLAFSIYVRLAE